MEGEKGGRGDMEMNGELSAVWKPVCVCEVGEGIRISSQLAANLLYDFEQVISPFCATK